MKQRKDPPETVPKHYRHIPTATNSKDKVVGRLWRKGFFLIRSCGKKIKNQLNFP